MPKLKYPSPTEIAPDATWSELKIVLRRLGEALGYACPEDWYQLRMEDLARVKGLKAHAPNPVRAARIIYPDLNPLLFTHRHRAR